MNRLAHVVAAVLAIVPASGTPRPPRLASVSATVDGLESLTHRPLVFMGAGPGSFGAASPCEHAVFALYEDGLVIYTRGTTGECPTVRAQIAPARAREIADTIAAGLADAPHTQWVTNCTDQGGLSIRARRGSEWYGTRVDGLDRFGEATCTPDADDRPYPNTLAALRLIASFDAPGAVPWVATDFAIELSPGAIYPPDYQNLAVPWPDDLPLPDLGSYPHFPVTDYDAKYLEAARRAVSPLGRSFVTLHGKTWAYGLSPAVLPGHAYLRKVDVALSRNAAALGPDRWR